MSEWLFCSGAVSAVSGTTRDAVDTEVVDQAGTRFNLIDTAGIRKRSSVTDSQDGAEPLSVQRAIQAVRRAQVGLAAHVQQCIHPAEALGVSPALPAPTDPEHQQPYIMFLFILGPCSFLKCFLIFLG